VTDGVEIRVQGLEVLHARMRAVSEGMRKKAARAAMRKGANIVRDAAKAAAQQIDRPETPLNISKNIAVQFNGRLLRTSGDVGFRVGVRGGAKQYANTKENRRKRRVGGSYKVEGSTWYWRLIEFGTSRFGAKPFMRPALENNAPKVLQAIVTEMNKQLDRLAKKGMT
jgi:HK97 gp10 family phage protein